MIRITTVLVFLHVCCGVLAATVDTVEIKSIAMKNSSKCVVIKPDSYTNTTNSYPAVYLLHGYSGQYDNWIKAVPSLKLYADKYQLLIVCPDGGYGSWYFDSPIDSNFRYETYVGMEIPAYIDQNYRTQKDRTSRAITGLSMGGHGGLFLGFRHADIFGACGSMSGGVDMRPFPERWDIKKRIGELNTHEKTWENLSVITVIENYPSDSIAIIVDCGTEDFFYNVNHALHEKMLQLKIPHTYTEQPGAHNWDYWSNAVEYQILFFSKFFRNKKQEK